MTLAELADLVCDKIGQSDAESVAQCQRYLQARMRGIWDCAPWRETLGLARATVPAGQEWLLLPASLERVLKLRADPGRTLVPYEAGALCDFAPELFASGPLLGFTPFAPVVLGPSATGEDVAVVLQATAPEAAQDFGRRASLEVELANGDRVIERSVHDGTGFAFAQFGAFVVRLEKEATVGDYQVALADGTGFGPIARAAETQFARRPRLRLLQPPASDTPVLALGKRHFPGWENGFEAPPLGQSENALIAYAMADMLERQRQYGKAQLKLQQAQTELAQLLDLERQQTATETRICPALCN